MERVERLKSEIIAYLLEHRESILMDHQHKFCGPCGGMKVSKVYRDPKSGHLGRLIEQLESAIR